MTRDELERELLAQPVRSLQYMLRRLSLQYPFLPEIVGMVCLANGLWRR